MIHIFYYYYYYHYYYYYYYYYYLTMRGQRMPVFLLVAFTVNFARKSLSCAVEMVIGFSKLQESTETLNISGL